MYTIQLDTVKNFECTLKIQGASLTKSKVNLVIESNDMDIRCRGTINEKGKVSIPVKKLKGILDENSKGKMYLEVIAEDSYFTPYKTDYITELSKKVDISENITVKSVKKIVEAETQDIQCHAGKIIKSITESKLNICNPSDKNKASTLIRQYLNNTNLTKEEYTQLMEEVLNQLSMII
jgi:hypothetical protein